MIRLFTAAIFAATSLVGIGSTPKPPVAKTCSATVTRWQVSETSPSGSFVGAYVQPTEPTALAFADLILKTAPLGTVVSETSFTSCQNGSPITLPIAREKVQR